MKLSRIRKTVFASVMVLALLLGVLSHADNGNAAAMPITWFPDSIAPAVPTDGSEEVAATFTSSTALTNVDLKVVPALQSYLHVSPDHFDAVASNTPYRITLQFTAPPGAMLGTRKGIVQVKVGGKAYPRPLQVDLKIFSPAVYPSGNDTIVTTGVIGHSGGVIVGGEVGSPVDAVWVDFPAGALPGDTLVFLGFNDGAPVPVAGTYSGTSIVLHVKGVRQIDMPIKVIAPLKDPVASPVAYYVDSDGYLHIAPLTDIDVKGGTFTFLILQGLPFVEDPLESPGSSVTFAIVRH